MRSFIRGLLTILSRLGGGVIDLTNSRYERQIKKINERGQHIGLLSDAELQRQAAAIRSRTQNGTPLDHVLIDLFAIIKEVARRTLGMQLYDVQLLAALALHDRKLVEMQTGEGKTLAAVLPACLRACMGRGVHVLTFNDYLAARDAAWMGPIYCFLGLTVGHVAQGMAIVERRNAYACDVTYVTAKEAGFDFLRDQVCFDRDQLVQRGFHFAIVDEADSILIDEARVPLVIAGQTNEEQQNLGRLATIVRRLRRGRDYAIDNGWRNVSFNSSGLDRLQRELQCAELYSEDNVSLLTRLNLALQAEVLLRRDRDYLVRDGAIVLIDEFTGRVAENRRWPYGLQAAIEAKEQLVIQPQGKILNSITLQHFLQQYECLSGMTGTAQEAAEELHEFYDLKIVIVPPNRPCVRRDWPDRVFRTKAEKYSELVREITTLHERGCPVLVGTASVEESEHLADRLAESGCECQILNARNDRQEAAVIAEAGAFGAVTISTNMAGRGTDIRLGGSEETDRDRVIAAGGLHVIGTNRHESRRIDNQLRGRSGRQGDPGESRFFISIEDDLISRHKISEMIDELAEASSIESLDDPRVGPLIAHVQRVIEGESFEIRRTLRKYSFCLERQRRTVHEYRRGLLLGVELPTILRKRDPDLFQKLADEVGDDVIQTAERQITLWQIDRCWSDHLANVAEIREQIYLMSMGGFNALDEYNRQITQAFRELTTKINNDVLAKMRTIRLTSDGLDLAKEGIVGPSSTWTYMINDNPMGDMFERLNRGLRRMIRGK